MLGMTTVKEYIRDAIVDGSNMETIEKVLTEVPHYVQQLIEENEDLRAVLKMIIVQEVQEVLDEPPKPLQAA